MITRTLTLAALAAASLGIAVAQAHAAQRFDVSGEVDAPDNRSAALRQSGPFHWTPLGAGTATLAHPVGEGSGARERFKMVNRRGQIWGPAALKLTLRLA